MYENVVLLPWDFCSWKSQSNVMKCYWFECLGTLYVIYYIRVNYVAKYLHIYTHFHCKVCMVTNGFEFTAVKLVFMESLYAYSIHTIVVYVYVGEALRVHCSQNKNNTG